MPLSDRRIEELVRLYETAEARLDATVTRAVADSPTRKRKMRTLSEVRSILDDLRSESEPAAKRLVVASYEEGMKATKAAKTAATAGPHRLAVEALAEALVANLDEARYTVGRSVNDVFRQETLKQVAAKMAAGEAPSRSAKMLETALKRRGITAFVDRRGAQWRLATYAKMATRTTAAQAQTHGVVNRMLQTGLDLVTITKHSHPSDVCSDFDGRTFSLTGAIPGYPIILHLPPFHPNCKHRAYVAAANANVKVQPRRLALISDRYLEAA